MYEFRLVPALKCEALRNQIKKKNCIIVSFEIRKYQKCYLGGSASALLILLGGLGKEVLPEGI